MIIELHDPLRGGAPEWVLLELQGKIAAAGAFDGRLVGLLKAAGGGRLTLQVGNHTIEGAFTALDKALHVLRRVPAADADAAPAYVVACVVRRKLVFTDRPEQLISAAAAALGGAPPRT